MAKMLKTGAKFGQWTLIGDHIDKGGNSYIWKVKNDAGDHAVIKLLQEHLLQQIRQPTGMKKVERFLREIRFYREHVGLAGILPLIDSYLPEPPSTQDPPWLVTKLAIPAHMAFTAERRDFIAIVSFITEIARTLSTLHAKSIFHRDIKPQNLFVLDGQAKVGDFGLVELPDLEHITDKGEELGPRYYIAPEMISAGADSEGGPADVYSLAKTLWVLATGQTHPLPGEQRIDVPALTLSAYVLHERAVLLDSLLERATSVTPSSRPTMEAFERNLEQWLREPTVATKPIGLSHLKSRLEAALEPGRRVQERREECEELAATILGELVAQLERVREVMSQVVPVSEITTDDTVFREFRKYSSMYPRHQQTFFTTVGMSVTSIGSGRNLDEMSVPDVHLWTGGGIAIALDTKDVYLAAGHIAGFTDYRPIVFGNENICIYGTSEYANTMAELGNGLIENLERALEAFTECCATVRPPHLS